MSCSYPDAALYGLSKPLHGFPIHVSVEHNLLKYSYIVFFWFRPGDISGRIESAVGYTNCLLRFAEIALN